jgi:hypothetical protein
MTGHAANFITANPLDHPGAAVATTGALWLWTTPTRWHCRHEVIACRETLAE